MLLLTSPTAAGPLPLLLAASTSVIPPLVLFILCFVGAVGTVMLLPGRRERALRMIGGVVLLSSMLVFAAVILRNTTRTAGEVYFWIFSAIAIISALRVISHPRPVYSALYFVLTVVATAGLFVLLWAEFMAAALVLIYAGAILVTYVFVIMLAQQAQTAGTTLVESGAEYDRLSREPVAATVTGFALLGLILFLIFDRAGGLPAGRPLSGEADSIQRLGAYLFTWQALTLELAGLILTIGMVGAVIIARRQVADETATHGEVLSAEAPSAQAVNVPLTPVNDNPHSIPVYGTDNPSVKSYPEA